MKYSFVNILSIFSSFQCLYKVRFEWDTVLSNSYDGWDKRGYTMWFPREGTFTLLNCVWLYLKAVQIQHTWTLWVSTFKKLKLHEVRLTTLNLSATLTKRFVKCNVNLFIVNKCITYFIFELTWGLLIWAMHLVNRHSSLAWIAL